MKTATALRSLAFLAGVLFALPAAGGNRVFVSAAGQATPVGPLTLQQGDPVTLDLRMDFLDTTVGGGTALILDAALLQLDSVSFDAQLGDDPDLRCAPTSSGSAHVACPGDPDAVAFGALTGLAGQRVVATLELTALANGTSNPGVTAAYPFSDTTGRPLTVIFLPEPGQLTLLAAGIAQLLVLHGWRSRRRP